MPPTALTPIVLGGSAGKVLVGAGTAEVAGDNVNGNSYQNANGKSLLVVRNSTAGALNITLTTPITVDGNAVADPVVSVPANGVTVIGPLDPSIYGNVVTATPAAATLFLTAIVVSG